MSRFKALAEGQAWTPWLLILPGLAFYALFVLVPIVATFALSLFRWDGLLPPKFIGLDNFVKLVGTPGVQQAFGVSLAFIAFSCILPVAAALLIVGAVTRVQVRGLSIFRLLYFLPYTLALAVVAIAWRWLYANDGIVAMVVNLVFGDGSYKPLLGDFDFALPALGIVAMWTTFGFVVVLLLAGAQHIPKDLYDAARVDGAGPVREFFAVTVPGLRYELGVALTMTTIFALRMFDLPLMATGGGPGYATTTPSLMMYRNVFTDGAVGYGSGIAVLLTIVTFVAVPVIGRLPGGKE